MSKILVVDDEAGMRQVISKILAPLGHEIIDTDEGARSIQMAKEQAPDLVLLDIRLADMDAPDIIRGLQTARPGVPIIVLSGFGDIETAVELVKFGAFDYISKPFKVNDFVNVVNKALTKSAQNISPLRIPASLKSEQKPEVVKATREVAAAIFAVKKPKGPAALIIFLSVFAAAAVTGIYSWNKFFNLPQNAEFKLASSNPSGICFDGKSIWVSDWGEQTVYKYSLGKDFKLETIFKTQDISPTGLAFDGNNILTSSSLDQKIYKHRLDASLSVEASFDSPGPSPAGLCFDGKNLWSVDFQQGKVYKHKAGNPSEIDVSFDVPAENPCGVFVRGGYIYVADAKTNRIYKLDLSTFFLAEVYEMPGFETQQRHIASIAYDGKSVWACAGGVDKLFRYKMSSLKRVKF